MPFYISNDSLCFRDGTDDAKRDDASVLDRFCRMDPRQKVGLGQHNYGIRPFENTSNGWINRIGAGTTLICKQRHACEASYPVTLTDVDNVVVIRDVLCGSGTVVLYFSVPRVSRPGPGLRRFELVPAHESAATAPPLRDAMCNFLFENAVIDREFTIGLGKFQIDNLVNPRAHGDLVYLFDTATGDECLLTLGRRYDGDLIRECFGLKSTCKVIKCPVRVFVGERQHTAIADSGWSNVKWGLLISQCLTGTCNMPAVLAGLITEYLGDHVISMKEYYEQCCHGAPTLHDDLVSTAPAGAYGISGYDRDFTKSCRWALCLRHKAKTTRDSKWSLPFQSEDTFTVALDARQCQYPVTRGLAALAALWEDQLIAEFPIAFMRFAHNMYHAPVLVIKQCGVRYTPLGNEIRVLGCDEFGGVRECAVGGGGRAVDSGAAKATDPA